MKDGTYGLVCELDESTLHERDDRRVIPVSRDRHLEVRPRRLIVGSGYCVIRCSCLAASFRSHRLSGARVAPRHPLAGAIDTTKTHPLNLCVNSDMSEVPLPL